MAQAKRPAADDPAPPAKRAKTSHVDYFSGQADETLLLISFYLSVQDLVNLQKVSRRFNKFGEDEQLWKAAYYNRFLIPRTNKQPIPKSPIISVKKRSRKESEKLKDWLDEDAILKRNEVVNWKKKYKTHHRWATGRATVKEIVVATTTPSSTPIFSKLHDGIIYTVDCDSGLRAWMYKPEHKLLASIKLEARRRASRVLPTCLSLNASSKGTKDLIMTVGFEDGSFQIYGFLKSSMTFSHHYSHLSSLHTPIIDIVSSWPYVATVSKPQNLNLYKFSGWLGNSDEQHPVVYPDQLLSLQAETVWEPKDISLRVKDSKVTVSIAYCFPTYCDGWSAAVQEIVVSTYGETLSSRTASGFVPGFQSQVPYQPFYSPPVSLSYAYPYLLVSHSNNILAYYYVNSSPTDFTISGGKPLVGHTAGIQDGIVDTKGRAISVCTKGNEVRIWDLKEDIDRERSELTKSNSNFGVAINLKQKDEEMGRRDWVSRALKKIRRRRHSNTALHDTLLDYEATTMGITGVDDESAVVLREQCGKQVLIVYDFT